MFFLERVDMWDLCGCCNSCKICLSFLDIDLVRCSWDIFGLLDIVHRHQDYQRMCTNIRGR